MLDKFQCRNRFRCSKSALRRLALANLEPNRSELKYPKVRRPQIISVYAMFQCANYADYRKTRLPCRRRRFGCSRGHWVLPSSRLSWFGDGLPCQKPLSPNTGSLCFPFNSPRHSSRLWIGAHRPPTCGTFKKAERRTAAHRFCGSHQETYSSIYSELQQEHHEPSLPDLCPPAFQCVGPNGMH